MKDNHNKAAHSCCHDIVIPASQGKTEGEVFICPMHPHVVSKKPGMCPECGMALVPGGNSNNDDTAHDKHAGHKRDSFLRKFFIAIILTIPILIYSELPLKLFGWSAPAFAGLPYVELLLGSVIFFYCGSIFLTSAYREIKGRLPGMMTLIALAITAAYAYSVYSVFRGMEHTLFWELSTLIAVMLLGHFIEMKSVQGAQGALRELAKLLPDKAHVIRDGKTETISISELKVGDIVLVKPGEKIPADGIIVEGSSEVNESLITGESKPVLKDIGKEAIAGSINGDGSLKIKIEKIGESTFLAGVMRLVEEAQSSKSRLQMLSDRAALYLTFIALGAGIITFVAWILAKAGFSTALERLVAVLVIACPHALGLAIPLVASISTTMAARNGFLIKHRLSLELARKIDTVVFDKTGTLTKGEFGVHRILSEVGQDENSILIYASIPNAHSEHPIGKALVKEAQKRNLSIPEVKNYKRIAGQGAYGLSGEKEIYVGNEELLKSKNISISGVNDSLASQYAKQGMTVIHVAFGGKYMGSIALMDIIRDESFDAVSNLKKLGIRVAMITGDSNDVAESVSKSLKIDEFFGRVAPHQKIEKIKLLQSQGRKVAMVGDGINDAPALTQADVGIAIGAGTNVAIESAGIILVKNDPRDIAKIINLSKLTYNKMVQNLFWATAYNLVAMPVAAGALAFKGIILQPAVAAIFMSLSTVIVAFNALLLRSKKLE